MSQTKDDTKRKKISLAELIYEDLVAFNCVIMGKEHTTEDIISEAIERYAKLEVPQHVL